MLQGICSFCGLKEELVNSHVIPKCFYQISKRGSMTMVDIGKQQKDKVNFQNGFKEHLMCGPCDNLIGELDRYANEILFHIIPKNKCEIESPVGGVFLIKDFDYEKIRKFFISLIWRISVSNLSFALGSYENTALQILKGELPDDESLFLPVVFRRNTNTPVDNITAVVPHNNFLGKEACRIMFPEYEIIIIVDTKNSNNHEIMELYKKMFTKDEMLVMEINVITPTDKQFIEAVRSCQ